MAELEVKPKWRHRYPEFTPRYRAFALVPGGLGTTTFPLQAMLTPPLLSMTGEIATSGSEDGLKTAWSSTRQAL